MRLEIEWDGLAREGAARLYADSWPAIYFEPLIGALESIARDTMGKQALAGALKSVVIQDSRGNYYADTWARFAEGVLTLDHEPFTNAPDVQDRTGRLVGVLESAL